MVVWFRWAAGPELLSKGVETVSEKRRENARRVASGIIRDKKTIADLRAYVDLLKEQVAVHLDECAHWRDAFHRAAKAFHAPSIDGVELPGDLTVGDLADIAGELKLRVRPRLGTLERSIP